MKCVLTVNGSIIDYLYFKNHINSNDFLIAVDGGYKHFQKICVLPNLILGDMDSISKEDLKYLESKNILIEKYPTDKNQTDLELALDKALLLGASEVEIFGAFGNRWDHSLANMLILANAKYNNLKIILLDKGQKAFIIKGTMQLTGNIGDTISLIPITSDVAIKSTKGLLYPLKKDVLKFSSPRGVSNVLTKKRANIEVTNGKLMCIQNNIRVGG